MAQGIEELFLLDAQGHEMVVMTAPGLAAVQSTPRVSGLTD
jgi:hypothetical protein